MLAETLCGHSIGRNWTSTFLRRNKQTVTSKYWRIQEIARLKADTPETRRQFYSLVSTSKPFQAVLNDLISQLSDLYADGHYTPSNIYNMDETGFKLSTSRRTRSVGPTNATSSKLRASLSNAVHITVVATISTTDTPVPPFIIYPGQTLLEKWLIPTQLSPKLMATASESGYTNTFITKQWLIECFDVYTKDRAQGQQQLLFLDGHKSHIQIEFLEACWDRNIVCVVLPASMSSIFQPLDVNFLNSLQNAYEAQVHRYQLGSTAGGASKGMFYGWLQAAWAEAATGRQIRAAWKDSGLWPLNTTHQTNGAITPPLNNTTTDPVTPHTIRQLQMIDRGVRRGAVSPEKAFEKAEKGLSKVLAENVLLKHEFDTVRASQELDRVARSKKRTRLPRDEVFDQRYREDHLEELAEQKEKEVAAKRKRQATERSKRKQTSSNQAREVSAGPSGTVQEE